MEETFSVELHLGQVAAINPDATINIFDYKVGSKLYTNIQLDHTAADIQQPIVGHEVLFFVVTIGDRETQVRVIRFFGNSSTDSSIVFPGGTTDIQPGERKMISNSGASVYLANGSAFLGSIGQSVVFDDESMTCTVTCKNLKVLTFNGFVIEQKDNSLVIKKGVYDPTLMDVPVPTTTVTLTDGAVEIDSPTVIMNNGVQPMVRGQALVEWLTNHVHLGNLGAPTTPPVQPPSSVPGDPTSIVSETEFLE